MPANFRPPPRPLRPPSAPAGLPLRMPSPSPRVSEGCGVGRRSCRVPPARFACQGPCQPASQPRAWRPAILMPRRAGRPPAGNGTTQATANAAAAAAAAAQTSPAPVQAAAGTQAGELVGGERPGRLAAIPLLTAGAPARRSGRARLRRRAAQQGVHVRAAEELGQVRGGWCWWVAACICDGLRLLPAC